MEGAKHELSEVTAKLIELVHVVDPEILGRVQAHVVEVRNILEEEGGVQHVLLESSIDQLDGEQVHVILQQIHRIVEADSGVGSKVISFGTGEEASPVRSGLDEERIVLERVAEWVGRVYVVTEVLGNNYWRKMWLASCVAALEDQWMELVLLVEFECPGGWESHLHAQITAVQHTQYAKEGQAANKVDDAFAIPASLIVLLIIVEATPEGGR